MTSVSVRLLVVSLAKGNLHPESHVRYGCTRHLSIRPERQHQVSSGLERLLPNHCSTGMADCGR